MLTVGVTYVWAWGGTGHHIINIKAPMHLTSAMGQLKADSNYYAAHASDADFRKISGDTNMFAEAPRHFIDIDWYPNFHSIPHSFDSMVAIYGWSRVKSEGVNPWETVIELDSLTAELRRGDMAHAESTMADLGHYVGDAHQPLHCANNYDGQYTGNNGVHSRYETSMINTYQSLIVIQQDSAHYVANPLDFVFAYIYHSNTFVDSIMAADTYAKSVSGWSGSGTAPASYYTALWQKTGAFTIDQFQRATVDLASLWYTAWVNAQNPTITFDTLMAIAMGNGTIAPSGVVQVLSGLNQKFTISPHAGYHVDSVAVDGNRVDSVTSFTFYGVDTTHAITAWFGINHYTISAGAPSNGSIVPPGIVTLAYGDSQSYSMTPDSGYGLDSVIVDGSNVGTATSYVFHSVAGNHAISANFSVRLPVIVCSVDGDWNIISVPCSVADSRRSKLFPTAASPAFGYDGSYSIRDTLRNGAGYWLKFAGAQSFPISGNMLSADTVAVGEGWNLIGSISSPVPVPGIGSVPGGIVTSNFFGYKHGYYTTDTLKPGYGYWVKVSQGGDLILSSGGPSALAGRIRITPHGERPPVPPGGEQGAALTIPREYKLSQAFPNPFNPVTTIHFELPRESRVTLRIYNLLGSELQTLVDETRGAGKYDVRFDASALSSGVYLCRIVADDFTQTEKVVLLR
jgi:hypothetical protein